MSAWGFALFARAGGRATNISRRARGTKTAGVGKAKVHVARFCMVLISCGVSVSELDISRPQACRWVETLVKLFFDGPPVTKFCRDPTPCDATFAGGPMRTQGTPPVVYTRGRCVQIKRFTEAGICCLPFRIVCRCRRQPTTSVNNLNVDYVHSS